MSKSEDILTAAGQCAQAHGYGGLNFRSLAAEVGMKAASIYHHFPSKADLGAAVAKRYWQDTAADLEAISDDATDAIGALHAYPQIFRRTLERNNRLCLGSFMSAEHDDLPDAVKVEVRTFGDVNVAWLVRMLTESNPVIGGEKAMLQAQAIFAAIAGAQLMARSRNDIGLFDSLIDTYRMTGLLPSANL